MVNNNAKFWIPVTLLAAIGLLDAASLHAAAPDQSAERGRAEAVDNRTYQGHPPRGAMRRTLPRGYRPYYYRGSPYYFHEGVWYAPARRGYVVVRPPIGLQFGLPPPYYTTIWYGGIPYYYADDTYYQWLPELQSYAVVPPPPIQRQSPQPESAPAAAVSARDDFFVYPKNGQSKEQQDVDRFECHAWARNETGFDPTQPGGGVPSDQNGTKSGQYDRATGACLEARGYSIK